MCNAEEYERASWFYANCVLKVIEEKFYESSQVSYLTMLWHGIALPSEMTVVMKTVIRLLQIQLANLTYEGFSFEINDICRLIEKLPTTTPLKAIASCYAITQFSQIGKM